MGVADMRMCFVGGYLDLSKWQKVLSKRQSGGS